MAKQHNSDCHELFNEERKIFVISCYNILVLIIMFHTFNNILLFNFVFG